MFAKTVIGYLDQQTMESLIDSFLAMLHLVVLDIHTYTGGTAIGSRLVPGRCRHIGAV